MVYPSFNRRDLLRLAMASAVLPSGLVQGAPQPAKARGMILVMLEGGMSQYESWDPKPLAPKEIRGEFGTIETSVPGIRISEHLPLMARELHRGNLLRAVHCDARNDHSPGMHVLLTGYENVGAGVDLERKNFHNPSVGSVLSKLLGVAGPGGAPRFVGLPKATQLNGYVNYNGPAFLGAAYEAFETGNPPQSAKVPGIVPPGLVLAPELSAARARTRLGLAAHMNALQPDLDPLNLQSRRDAHYERAMQVLTGKQTQVAFELERESPALRAAYGDNPTGQGLLLARRLIEAGVTYVCINANIADSWDTHQNNFSRLKQKLLPPIDRGISTLLTDLDDRGELDDVLILVAGEMGRTPSINRDAGRDHWTTAYSVFLAGGGLTRGQVIGKTTPDGSHPAQRPVTVHDILATAYQQLGVDPHSYVQDRASRPVPILPDGAPIADLIA